MTGFVTPWLGLPLGRGRAWLGISIYIYKQLSRLWAAEGALRTC